MTVSARKPAPMSEATLQSLVIDLAHAYGWKVAHFRPSRTSKGWRTPVSGDGIGFFDLVMAKDGCVIFAELKSDKGYLTAAQMEWNEILGEEAHIWRPVDWHSGEIQRVLSGVTPGAPKTSRRERERSTRRAAVEYQRRRGFAADPRQSH